MSSATINGAIHLDDCVLETKPPMTFDFKETELFTQLSGMQDVQDITRDRLPIVRIFVFGDERALRSSRRPVT